jgi:beta-phosphoglucomutase-like phosphatase (HAD superfamily)
MANFNIGQQNAANIQNIGGNATIEGGIHATANWETLELRRTIARTRDEIAGLDLPTEARETVNQSLDAASQEASATKPDRYKVGEHLGAATRTLKEAGALIGAGTAVVQSLSRAAQLLGPAGLATIAAAL